MFLTGAAIDTRATEEEIKKAYKKLALQYHPGTLPFIHKLYGALFMANNYSFLQINMGTQKRQPNRRRRNLKMWAKHTGT